MNKESIIDKQVEKEAEKLFDKFSIIKGTPLKYSINSNLYHNFARYALEQQRELREALEKINIETVNSHNYYSIRLQIIKELSCNALNPKGGDETPIRNVGFEQLCREKGQCINAIPVTLPASPASEVTNEVRCEYCTPKNGKHMRWCAMYFIVSENKRFTLQDEYNELDKKHAQLVSENSTLRAELAAKSNACDAWYKSFMIATNSRLKHEDIITAANNFYKLLASQGHYIMEKEISPEDISAERIRLDGLKLNWHISLNAKEELAKSNLEQIRDLKLAARVYKNLIDDVFELTTEFPFTNSGLVENIKRIKNKKEELETTNTKLRKALEKYGRHKVGCCHPQWQCTCGLKEALV